MDLDLIFAVLHFLLIFALVAIMTMELMLLRPGLSGANLARLGGIDGAYGGAAGALILVGFLRVFFGATDSSFYLTNWVFWAKIAAFVVVGLLSIKPTMDIIRWRRAASGDSGYVVPEGEVKSARTFLHAETAVFVLIPIFASLMARGYGLG
jgi:putative membrane protein